jgi:hypothetical protein
MGMAALEGLMKQPPSTENWDGDVEESVVWTGKAVLGCKAAQQVVNSQRLQPFFSAFY